MVTKLIYSELQTAMTALCQTVKYIGFPRNSHHYLGNDKVTELLPR